MKACTQCGRTLEFSEFNWKNRARLLAFFRAHPCVDCGEQDAIVLQFDHEDPSRKSATVADLFKRGFSWRTIEKEIAKCQIRCANDHLRRTGRQFG